MTPETKNLPEWARREREVDLDWIEENLVVFWTAAVLSFDEAGRGAMVLTLPFSPPLMLVTHQDKKLYTFVQRWLILANRS